MYRGIDHCDACGQLLEQMQWLVGLCRACEEAAKQKKKRVEVVKPKRGLL